MAKRKHGDVELSGDEIMPDQRPRQLISLGEHVDYLQDITPQTNTKPTKTKKAKKHKKSKRKHRYSSEENSSDEEEPRTRVHQLSDSNNSAEFEGYGPGNNPVFSRRQESHNTSLTSRLPSWLNEPTPPGPWHRRDRRPELRPLTSSDSEVEIDPIIHAPPPAEGMRMKNICLDEFMEKIATDEDVGPNVWPELAKLVEGCWSKHHKEDFKKICDEHKTPGNTPSLQKVLLDPELEAVLGDRYPRSKRTDTALQTIGGAISKAAICFTEILHVNMSDVSPETATKKTMAACFDALRILAHSHAKLQHTRRDVIKFSLDPAVSRSLNKNASIENSNATHKLFGGDVHKQAKEG